MFDLKLKEKLVEMLGAFGAILAFLLGFVGFVFPIIMITLSLELPFWVVFILLPIRIFVPFAGRLLWIFGLICAIMGTQDIIAIAYYICAAVVLIPDIFALLASFRN